MSGDRVPNVYLAKLSEQAERYDEMVSCMKKVAELGEELSVEERNLLSVAYKNVIGSRRAAWRIVHSIQQKEVTKESDKIPIIQTFLDNIEKELVEICNDVCSVLDKFLIPAASNGDAKVFYHKMKGDYFRYLAEFQKDEPRKVSAGKSEKAYSEASEIADAELPPTHPIRLGLALNSSVFYYEIENNHTKACALAKKAFDDAIAELESVDEESYKDSTLIMQLLRDNLSLWSSENQNEEEDKKDEA